MESQYIYPIPDSLYCEIEHPKSVQEWIGQTYVKDTDGDIFVCQPKNEHGRYPVRYQVFRDCSWYRQIVDLFLDK